MRRILLFLLLIANGAVFAQDRNDTTDRTKTAGLLLRVAEKYMKSPRLSFDILYRYSDEQAPGVYLDSLRGSCKMDGNRYWCLLDSTETIYNASQAIVLYRQDKLIYLTSPSSKAPAKGPLGQLDSFLDRKMVIRYAATHTDGKTIVTIGYDRGCAYKQVQYYINDNTGLLEKMVSIVRSSELYAPGARDQAAANSYAVVETLFSNYREQSFDTGIFDSSRYFTRQGGIYTPAASYNQYTIFLGKTGL
ncbi:MAG: hypothetical protein JST39_13300 [Bacteroidetes bacterium]|nr:hypothetical protein [Bacteroidota bacterium]